MMNAQRSQLLLFALALLLLLGLALVTGWSGSAAAQGEEDDRFVPSEELSADRAISFPVDI